MKNLSHDAAIDALCKCAASVSVLSYQEAIEGYFKLRGLLIPHAPSLAAQDGLAEALEHIVDYWNRDQNETAMADALWHIIETAESALASLGEQHD